MLKPDKALLVLVDVQGGLAEVMHERDRLFVNLRKLLGGWDALQLPAIVTEQNPSRLGPTRAEISDWLPPQPPVPKMAFSACGEPAFVQRLEAADRRQILLAGIEAHICICQTALDLLEVGYEVHVAADAVASRRAADRDIALDRMRQAGARITGVETALFELLRTAEHTAFKRVLGIVK